MLSNEELVKEIRNGVNVDENKMQLYKQNEGLIHKYINKYKGPDDELEDMEIEAYFAVDKAVEKYDEEKGCFNTWLGWQLKSVLHKYRIKTSGIPDNAFADAGKCKRAESTIKAEKGSATLEDLVERTGLPAERVRNAEKAILFTRTRSINKPAGEDPNEELADIIPDESDYFGDTIEMISKAELWETLKKLLNSKEYDIIRQVYAEGKTMKDIAAQYGVVYQTVSSAHKRIIEKLKYNRDLYSLYLK
jgi:RNA polymerase sigma factor (sigma-70 family)